MVPDANAGLNVPVLNARAARFAFVEIRVTVNIYVFVVVPSAAVTTTLIVFGPTARGILADAVPEATAIPFTVRVAVASLVVGFTFMAVVVTDAV